MPITLVSDWRKYLLVTSQFAVVEEDNYTGISFVGFRVKVEQTNICIYFLLQKNPLSFRIPYGHTKSASSMND